MSSGPNRKTLYFLNRQNSADSLKIGHNLRKLRVSKIEAIKKRTPLLIFFRNIRKIQMVLDIKSQL
jgi:hypothetical protein